MAFYDERIRLRSHRTSWRVAYRGASCGRTKRSWANYLYSRCWRYVASSWIHVNRKKQRSIRSRISSLQGAKCLAHHRRHNRNVIAFSTSGIITSARRRTVPLTAIITSTTLGSLRSDYGGWVGCKFTVGGSSITLQTLGRWVVSGNSQTHQINLRDSTGAELAVVTVNTSGATAATYLYGAITPVVLSSGGVYYLTSKENGGGDQWYEEHTVTASSGVTINNSCYYPTQTGIPIIQTPSKTFVPVNAQY
jgi:hypothetical protein